jgi:phage protein U
VADNLFTLGTVVFRAGTNNLDDYSRRGEYRHNFVSVLRGEGARTFTGKGSDFVTLSGRVFPGQYGNASVVDELRALARIGRPLQLMRGDGRLIGRYCITAIEEDQPVLLEDGQGRMINFTIDLRKDPLPFNV